MTRSLLRRTKKFEIISSAAAVLISGVDFFSDFDDTDGPARLQELWSRYGVELLAEYFAKDSSTKPMAWWWSAPENVRIEFPKVLLRTEQRGHLIKHKLLNGAALAEARAKIQQWEKSGKPMAYFHLSNP